MQIQDNIKFTFNATYSTGDKECQNILIHGDNKDVLSELCPEFVNRIRCIYIDPPYNNGETYHYYDDNNTQGDWLRDMRRVLNLLKPLLSKDGSIWISIDDSEMAYLRVEADRIFCRDNFAGTIIWQQRKSRENRAVFSCNHEYILVYAKDIKEFKKKRNLLPVDEDYINSKYKNPDNDPRGPWQSVTANVQSGHAVPSQFYTVVSPTGVKHDPPKGRCWIYNEERMKREIAEGNIWFGKDGSNTPRVKKFLRDAKIGLTPETIWLADEVGTSDSAKKQLMALFPDKEKIFETPKPEELLKRIIEIASDEGDYVLDCYIGSGTTIATAHKLNRHYIGIEIGNQMSELVVKRMSKVIEGENSGISELVGWEGGGDFVFYNFDKTKVRQNAEHASLPTFHGNTFERLRTAVVRQLDFFDLFQCEIESVNDNYTVREDSWEQGAIKDNTQNRLSNRDIESKYCLFTLQLKPFTVDNSDNGHNSSSSDRFDRVIEQKYFRKLLGKAFRPYKEEEFLYLSLESGPEYFDDNMKLLSDLSKDFYIRYYKLGTDPRDVINKFADLTYALAVGQGTGTSSSKVFRFEDFKDEIFLIGGYRSGDKNQLTWIKEHLMYNIRATVNRHGYRNGIIDENVVSARYLVLYEINDKEKRNYHIYRIESWKLRSTEWMERHDYPEPDGSYIVYSLVEEVHFEYAVVNSMIEKAKYNEIGYRKNIDQAVSQKWMDDHVGAPGFLKGIEIAEYALASHRKTGKAVVTVDFNDKELTKMDTGLSVHTFVSDDMNQYLKNFTESSYVIYSNKNAYKVFKIVGVPFVSIEPQEDYMVRRFAAPIKKQYPDSKQRDKQREDFCLNFKLVPAEDVPQLSQEKINKKPEGLSVYDFHVVDINSVI